MSKIKRINIIILGESVDSSNVPDAFWINEEVIFSWKMIILSTVVDMIYITKTSKACFETSSPPNGM